MRRAFKWIRLPLGAFQFVNLTAEDLGDQSHSQYGSIEQ